MRLSAPNRLLATVAALVVATGGVAPGSPVPPRRVVAIGDIHGAYDAAVELLRGTGLVDEQLHWSGGNTLLVQTGDVTDRGAGVRQVMDLLMRLQLEAPENGGEVVVLLGNHEVMNLVSEVRDVTPAIMQRFAAADASSELEEAFAELQETSLRQDEGWQRASPRQRRQIRDSWVAEHPAGYPGYLRALGPDGIYGSWLRSLPAIRVIDGVLFMHAGIAPDLAAAGWELTRVSARIATEIATFDRYRAYLRERQRIPGFATLREIVRAAAQETGGLDWFRERPAILAAPPTLPPVDLDSVGDRRERFDALFRITDWHLLQPEGPMWFRGLARWSDEDLSARVPELLRQLQVRAIVVGHTPQPDGIRVRADGSVFLIDTGMLKEVYGGRAAALELYDGEASILHPDGSREPVGSLPAASVVTSPES